MSTHPVQWQSPQPLWARFASGVAGTDQTRPAILRFASDDFMEQLLATLARDPAQLGRLLAQPETWRSPMSGGADLLERTPLPSAARTAARFAAATQSKSSVAATSSEADIVERSQTRRLPLKLYQPAHQRFYLAGASLVCGLQGLPERAVAPGGSELVKMVVRRLMPKTKNDSATDTSALREFAYIKDADGARWRRVGADSQTEFGARQLAPGEELLPVFPLNFSDDARRARTLWTGMVPVGRREEYLGAEVDRSPAPTLAVGQRQSLLAAAATTPAQSKQARVAQFKMEVAEPWKNLIRSAYTTSATLTEAPPDDLDGEETAADKKRRVFDFNLQQQTVSWLILLDFADYLAVHLPEVWRAIDDNGASAGALSGNALKLYNWFGNAAMPNVLRNALRRPSDNAVLKTPATSLRAALKSIRSDSVRTGLEGANGLYTEDSYSDSEWPSFHFVLAGVDDAYQPSGPFDDLDLLEDVNSSADEAEPSADASPDAAQLAAAELDRLTAVVGRALTADVETNAPPLPFAMQVRNAMAANIADPGWFVIRFVYTRADCGPLHAPTLSAATQKFQLASFFDADAPARPIRITLPLDTSAAGLRKHNRNTAFVMSDMLCGQIQRAKGLGLVDLVRAVLPWPLHKDLDVGGGGPCSNGTINIGMICSLSIPIITICALILLIIIVSLLDLIFRWLPYFIICFPVPGLKGKKGGS